MSEQAFDAQRVERLAMEVLNSLRECPEAGEIVLGGYYALKQYVDYRTTYDLDAWWRTGRTEGAMACIERVMRGVADRHTLVFAQREWGETVSFELSLHRRKIFSFQIAVRSVELEPARNSPWPPVLIESLADSVGSKMNALVQRGAPRDFLDIRELVEHGIVSVAQCWKWYARKNPGVDLRQARAQALRHLEALAQRRPIDRIEEPNERAATARSREWIRQILLQVPAVPGDDM